MAPGKEFREKLRQKLVEDRHMLLRDFSENLKDRHEYEGVSFPDLGDQAYSQRERELLNHLGETERGRLLSIDEALQRLQEDDFDECADCGDPIPEERLEAYPTAERCVQCQSAYEREHKVQLVP